MTEGALGRWDALSDREARALAARDPVVILPLAATEQHGPHLPATTDADINRALLARAATQLPDDVPAAVLPAVDVGASDEHLAASDDTAPADGTQSIGSHALSVLIRTRGTMLASLGIRRLVLHNTHGGNRHAMATAALDLRRTARMLVVSASWFRFPHPPGVRLPDAEWRHGLHGGAVETAMMLHLHPGHVRMDQIRRFTSLGEALVQAGSTIGPEGAAPFAWLARDLNRAGVVGDATLATAELGRRLIEHYGDTLARVICDAKVFPIDRLA